MASYELQSLKNRVSRLESRLLDIELRLGRTPAPPVPERTDAPDVPPAGAEALVPQHAPAAPPVHPAPPRTPEPATPAPSAPPTVCAPIGAAHTTAQAPPIHRPMGPRPSASSPFKTWMNALRARGVERSIGELAFAVVGAIVVIVSAALFLKLAYDQGWLGRVPDTMKCVSAALLGVALLGAGELARRRALGLAGACLSAAGVGSLYVAAYGTYGYFGLVGPTSAALMALGVSAIGVSVSVASRAVSVGVIAILGGYLAPFILWRGEPVALVIAIHLLALQGTALVLSGALGGRFESLRTFVWWGVALVGSAWALDIFDRGTGADAVVGLVFIALSWAATHAELIWAARRERFAGTARRAWLLRAARPYAGSVVLTLWALGLGAIGFDKLGSGAEPWLAALVGTILAGVVAFAAARPMDLLRGRPRTDRERLGALMLAQAGAMALIAIAGASSMQNTIIAWLALGAASCVAGTKIGSRALSAYGVVVLLLTAPYLLGTRWMWASGTTIDALPVAFVLTDWTAYLIGAAAAWLCAGLAVRAAEHGRARAIGDACLCAGTTWFFLAWMHTEADSAWNSIVTLAWSFTLVGVAQRTRSRVVAGWGVAALFVATLVLVAGNWSELRHTTTTAGALGLVVSPWSGLFAACAAAWLSMGFVSQRLGDVWREFFAWCVVAAAQLLMLSVMHADTDLFSASVAGAGVLCAIAAIGPRLGAGSSDNGVAAHVASVLTGQAALLWLWRVFVDKEGLVIWHRWTSSDAMPMLHPGLISGLLVAAMAVWIARRAARASTDAASPMRLWGIAVAGVVALTASSLEIGRVSSMMFDEQTARNAAVSIWWGLVAAMCLRIGFVRRFPWLRRFGLALMSVAVMKAALIDLGRIDPAWRVVSMLALGLLMLGVALAYARATRRLQDRDEAGPAPA